MPVEGYQNTTLEVTALEELRSLQRILAFKFDRSVSMSEALLTAVRFTRQSLETETVNRSEKVP